MGHTQHAAHGSPKGGEEEERSGRKAGGRNRGILAFAFDFFFRLVCEN